MLCCIVIKFLNNEKLVQLISLFLNIFQQSFALNKQPIGKFDDRLPYTQNKIEITKGDTLYLFTDGFADQFGGEKGKKLTKAKFKEKLVSIHTKPLSEQREELFTFLESYKGKLEQVDDICVIAVKV